MSVLVMHDGSVVAVVGWRSRFVSLFVGCSLLFVALLAVLLFFFLVVRFAVVFLCLIVGLLLSFWFACKLQINK